MLPHVSSCNHLLYRLSQKTHEALSVLPGSPVLLLDHTVLTTSNFVATSISYILLTKILASTAFIQHYGNYDCIQENATIKL
jgi:hypothetical protein